MGFGAAREALARAAIIAKFCCSFMAVAHGGVNYLFIGGAWSYEYAKARSHEYTNQAYISCLRVFVTS